jgi:hypothetical protein
MPNFEVSSIDEITICFSVFVCHGTHRHIHKSFDELADAERYYTQCLRSGVYEYHCIEKIVRIKSLPEDVIVSQKIDVGVKKEFPK